MIRLVLFIALALSLSSCFRTNEQSRTVYRGTVGDQLIQVEADGTTEKQSGVDIAQVVNTAVSAARGDFMKALEGMKPPPAPGFGVGEIIGGGSAAVALAMAMLKARAAEKRADEHKADADEGWSHVLEAGKKATNG